MRVQSRKSLPSGHFGRIAGFDAGLGQQLADDEVSPSCLREHEFGHLMLKLRVLASSIWPPSSV
jgi:hypothetical protein